MYWWKILIFYLSLNTSEFVILLTYIFYRNKCYNGMNSLWRQIRFCVLWVIIMMLCMIKMRCKVKFLFKYTIWNVIIFELSAQIIDPCKSLSKYICWVYFKQWLKFTSVLYKLKLVIRTGWSTYSIIYQ